MRDSLGRGGDILSISGKPETVRLMRLIYASIVRFVVGVVVIVASSGELGTNPFPCLMPLVVCINALDESLPCAARSLESGSLRRLEGIGHRLS